MFQHRSQIISMVASIIVCSRQILGYFFVKHTVPFSCNRHTHTHTQIFVMRFFAIKPFPNTTTSLTLGHLSARETRNDRNIDTN